MDVRMPLAIRQLGPVAIGLSVLGLASFAFLSVAGRALGPAELAPLGTLWVLINAIGPAFFQPLEQEVGRSVAARRAVGQGARPVLVRATCIAAGLVGLLALALLVAGTRLADAVFGGHDLMVLGLALGVAGLAAEHLTRGAFAGTGDFPRYGTQLAVDGVLRIGSAAALATLGVAVAGPYGLLLGTAPVLAVLLTAGRLRDARRTGPPESWRHLGHAIGWLTAGALAAQFVVNAAPVAANLIAGPDDQARAGVFISVLVLARVPLFLFAAIQASFLPGLAAMAAVDDVRGLRRRVGQIALLVLAIGVTGLVVMTSIGPWLVTLVYGPLFQTTRSDLWALAAASGFFMLASVVSQSLISVRAYPSSAVGWGAGALAFLAFLAVPLDLEERVGGAFLVGSVVATLTLTVLLTRRLGSGAPLSGRPTPPAPSHPEQETAPWR